MEGHLAQALRARRAARARRLTARWRRQALFVSWIVAAGWGIYYLIAVAPSAVPFVAVAVAHFIIGYVWGRGVMTPQLGVPLALTGTLMAGAFTRLALGMGTTEIYFAWAGPLAAAVLSDTTTFRNIAYSAAAFVLGYIALIWLAP